MTVRLKRDEALLLIIQMALAAGRKRQSKETGLVHIGDCIPLVENTLFALALFRSKTADQIIEGREIMERLLHFQVPNGNFPCYLHQYPKADDYFLAAELLASFHWILKDFGTVLGSTRDRIEESLEKIKQHLAKQEVKPGPCQAIKIGAINGHIPDIMIDSPKFLGELFIARQLAGKALLETAWNSEACCYDGPGEFERQDGYEPEVTLYDLFMAYRTNAFSERIKKDHRVHLFGALIRPLEMQAETRAKSFALSYHDVPEHKKRWHYRYKKVWGSKERTHSFVCQGGNISSFKQEGETLFFELGDPIEDDHRDKHRELNFYLDRQPIKIHVNGTEATTFSLGDELTLHLEDLSIRMRFDLEEGEGEFMGHVMLGNRPAQISEEPFEAFDWQIFIRTIRRSQQCSVRLSLQFLSR